MRLLVNKSISAGAYVVCAPWSEPRANACALRRDSDNLVGMRRAILVALASICLQCGDDDSTPPIDAGVDAPPAEEQCNGRDDDGDVTIDEGTDERCSAPFVVTASCQGALGCLVVECIPRYSDCNGTFVDGCEVEGECP